MCEKRIEAFDVSTYYPQPVQVQVWQDDLMILGTHHDGQDVQADPEKTEAIRRMDMAGSVSELRRFLGMVNQLGKFSPRIAEISQPPTSEGVAEHEERMGMGFSTRECIRTTERRTDEVADADTVRPQC